MKVDIKRSGFKFDARDVIEKTVKPFGRGSAHIIMPKKWLGHKVYVAINGKTGVNKNDN